MCGRIILSQSQSEISSFLKATLFPERLLKTDYNLTPSKDLYIVVDKRGEEGSVVRSMEIARWSLVPWWAKDQSIGNKLTNARSETVHDKPSLRDAYARRRCLVPVKGYYEWYVSSQLNAAGGLMSDEVFDLPSDTCAGRLPLLGAQPVADIQSRPADAGEECEVSCWRVGHWRP